MPDCKGFAHTQLSGASAQIQFTLALTNNIIFCLKLIHKSSPAWPDSLPGMRNKFQLCNKPKAPGSYVCAQHTKRHTIGFELVIRARRRLWCAYSNATVNHVRNLNAPLSNALQTISNLLHIRSAHVRFTASAIAAHVSSDFYC